MKYLSRLALALYTLYSTFYPSAVLAAGGGTGLDHTTLNNTILFLFIILLAAKLGGVIEKLGQPGVLGELGAGIALATIGFLGWGVIEDIRSSSIIGFLAQLGAIILLFEIGLESNLKKILSVGTSALLVAIIGVVTPFALGYFVLSPWLFPTGAMANHLFFGASLVATSVGITAVVLKNLGLSSTRAFQTVLGAAIIDDVLGLMILAIVSSIYGGHEITASYVGQMALESFGFLAGSIMLGQFLAKPLSSFFAKIHTGTGMKLSVALGFAFGYSYLATQFGLEPIIGAFAAGLVLDAVHFDSFDKPFIATALQKVAEKAKTVKQNLHELIHQHTHTHIEDMTHSLSILFVPIFFTYTGLQIDISVLTEPTIYLGVLIVSILAILTKLVAGIASPGSINEKILVGTSMIPRGEVGLIFAAVGKSLGVLDGRAFATIVLVAIITTFVSAPLINSVAKKYRLEK